MTRKTDLVDQIARAVLYEGYILYPYRPSVKNRQRWTFGGIFPQAWSAAQGDTDPDCMQTQFLIAGGLATRLSIKLRFLHLIDRAVQQAPAFDRVESLRVNGASVQSWQEAVERDVRLDDIALVDLVRESRREPFFFPASVKVETLVDNGTVVGRLVREQKAIQGMIELSARPIAQGLTQLTVRVVNQTEMEKTFGREQALMYSFASTHLIFIADRGEFVSLTDPPADMADAAAQCRNIGCWPVLTGEAGQTDTLLVSPIILPDYPQIAPESPGDLFDGCEIDEILTLRIMTLTDEEKEQAASVDDRVRQLLHRTETLARDQLMNLHGTFRGLRSTSPALAGALEPAPAETAANMKSLAGRAESIEPFDASMTGPAPAGKEQQHA